MKRKFSIAGESDHMHKFRRLGQYRIPLDKLGFLQQNRNGMGISPEHVHEVALDCLANTTKVSRYNCVEVVRLSAEHISAVRECNKQKCEA